MAPITDMYYNYMHGAVDVVNGRGYDCGLQKYTICDICRPCYILDLKHIMSQFSTNLILTDSLCAQAPIDLTMTTIMTGLIALPLKRMHAMQHVG